MNVWKVRLILLAAVLVVAAATVVLEVWARLKGVPAATVPAPAAVAAVPYYPAKQEATLRFTDFEHNRPVDDDAAEDAAERGVGISSFQSEPTWKKWGKYEARFRLSWTFANPYDPEEIAVDAIITTPSGAVEVVPAFWYVPCSNRVVAREEPVRNPDEDVLTVESISANRDGAVWMLRYTPREEGSYSYQLVARTPVASARDDRSFEVSGAVGRGFVRVSKQDSRYFELDDGSFFFPVGQNTAWPNDLGSVHFQSLLANMRHAGANWARLWLTPYFKGTTVEWSRKHPHYHGLGFYSEEIAWKLDQMLEEAERRDIRVMWCLLQHGPFSTQHNSAWRENPYNKEAGGFLDKPEQFFTHERARAMFRRLLRYLIARYGYSTHLFAWEFWNEVDLTDRFSPSVVLAWHNEMGNYVKQLDPTGRLVTTSYIRTWDNDAFALASQDFAQVHLYYGDAIEYAERPVDDLRRQFGKPVLIGEYGRGHKEDYFHAGPNAVWPVDPDGLHVHNSLWAGLFSGSAGTAMNWWWDKYIHKNNLYYHFTGISRFVEGEDLRRWNLRRVKLFDDYYRTPEALAYVLVGPDRAYGWIYETSYTLEHFKPGDRPRDGVAIELDRLNDGECWIEFWDTYDGVPTARVRGEVRNGEIKFRVPPFRGDIAFKLFCGEPSAELQSETPVHDAMVQKLRSLAERFSRR